MSKRAKPKKPSQSANPADAKLAAPSGEAGLSLDQLSAAFAEMLSTGSDPYEASEAAGADAESDDGETVAIEAAAACEVSPQTILEAMLFVGSPDNTPLRSEQIASLMRGVRPAEIDELVRRLNERYAERGRPYSIVSEDAGYRLTLLPQFHRIRDRFYGKVRQARLSQAAIEILSLVAYNQPLSGDDIARLRGTPCGAILSQLVRRQLLCLDRSDPEHRRGRYLTTPRFLKLFGLESLEELPRSEDVSAAP